MGQVKQTLCALQILFSDASSFDKISIELAEIQPKDAQSTLVVKCEFAMKSLPHVPMDWTYSASSSMLAADFNQDFWSSQS